MLQLITDRNGELFGSGGVRFEHEVTDDLVVRHRDEAISLAMIR